MVLGNRGTRLAGDSGGTLGSLIDRGVLADAFGIAPGSVIDHGLPPDALEVAVGSVIDRGLLVDALGIGAASPEDSLVILTAVVGQLDGTDADSPGTLIVGVDQTGAFAAGFPATVAVEWGSGLAGSVPGTLPPGPHEIVTGVVERGSARTCPFVALTGFSALIVLSPAVGGPAPEEICFGCTASFRVSGVG